jgi:hypothetical protein
MIMNAGGKSRSKINLMYSLSDYKVEPARLLTSLSYRLLVSDYGLDDRAIGVRSPAGAKDFSYSLFV